MSVDLLVVVAGVLGLGSLLRAVGSTRTFWHLVSADRVGPETEPGDFVRASGTVAPADDDLVAPLSGTPCVAYVLTQQLYYEAGYQIPLKRWRSERTAGEARPFSLDAATDAILVDGVAGFGDEPPGGLFADLRLDVDDRSPEYDPDESPPSPVVEAFDDLSAIEHPHRYVEWRIESGDPLSVIGTATELDDPTGESRVGIGDDGSVFVVSERAHWRTLLAFLVRAAAYGGFGALALGLVALRAASALA